MATHYRLALISFYSICHFCQASWCYTSASDTTRHSRPKSGIIPASELGVERSLHSVDEGATHTREHHASRSSYVHFHPQCTIHPSINRISVHTSPRTTQTQKDHSLHGRRCVKCDSQITRPRFESGCVLWCTGIYLCIFKASAHTYALHKNQNRTHTLLNSPILRSSYRKIDIFYQQFFFFCKFNLARSGGGASALAT